MPKKKKRMSLPLFLATFSSGEACRDYLFQQRWPMGFVCPKCAGTRYCRLAGGLCQCADCHHQTSVTAGTVMHRSHVPLRPNGFLHFISFRRTNAVYPQVLCGIPSLTINTCANEREPALTIYLASEHCIKIISLCQFIPSLTIYTFANERKPSLTICR